MANIKRIKIYKDIDNNSAQSKQLSEIHKHKNLNSSLIQFMENQDKKHLSTNFNHKNAEKFLKEKEKAMEEIIFEDEPMIESNESNYDDKEDRSKLEIKDKNKSVQFKKEKDENKSQYKSNNENNNILIFHGTFGEDKVNEIMKEHHHKHSHHHHHHHHHHHYENENKNKFAFEC